MNPPVSTASLKDSPLTTFPQVKSLDMGNGECCERSSAINLVEIAQRQAYGSLGLDPDPDLAFAGVRALRTLADFCESYQVSRARQAGHCWATTASWADVSARALHQQYAHVVKQRHSHDPLR